MRPIFWGGFWGLCALICFVLWLAGVSMPQGASLEALGMIFLTLSLFAPWVTVGP
jgi:hypothetical protein